MKIAVATLSNFHANPYGPELQVKQMLERRRFAARQNSIAFGEEINFLIASRGSLKITS